MAPAPKTAPTNGPVLKWARITRGLSAEIAAQRLGITTVDLRNMETGDDQPSVGLLSQMARVYRRPQGVLLLPFAPTTDPLPTDFRTVGGVGSALGEETLRAIFEARHVQHFVSELVEIEPELIRASNLPNTLWVIRQRQLVNASASDSMFPRQPSSEPDRDERLFMVGERGCRTWGF